MDLAARRAALGASGRRPTAFAGERCPVARLRHDDGMSTGEDLLEERRRRRRAGDPRLSAEGRELFRRMTTGDLVDELQADLDAIATADPLLGGQDSDD